jgi:hypothetical protein
MTPHVRSKLGRRKDPTTKTKNKKNQMDGILLRISFLGAFPSTTCSKPVFLG